MFLREYAPDEVGRPVTTGRMLDGSAGGLPPWGDVKAQARNLLGIVLTDSDATDLPLLATDEYGQFIRGAKGYAQIVMPGPDGEAGTLDDFLVEGDPSVPISTTGAVRTGHAFLNDIAHDAIPTGKVADGDVEVSLANLDGSDTSGNYDNELLDAHFITGDGRGNENVGLTAVHHIFHSEHNRLLGHIKDVVLAELGSSVPLKRRADFWRLSGIGRPRLLRGRAARQRVRALDAKVRLSVSKIPVPRTISEERKSRGWPIAARKSFVDMS